MNLGELMRDAESYEEFLELVEERMEESEQFEDWMEEFLDVMGLDDISDMEAWYHG